MLEVLAQTIHNAVDVAKMHAQPDGQTAAGTVRSIHP